MPYLSFKKYPHTTEHPPQNNVTFVGAVNQVSEALSLVSSRGLDLLLCQDVPTNNISL